MGFLAPRATPTTGETNTAAYRAKLLEDALRDLSVAAMKLTNEVGRLERREADAEARLDSVHALLWGWIRMAKVNWVLPDAGHRDYVSSRAAQLQLEEAIFQLADALGYESDDVGDPANIELELQKRGLA